VALLLCVHIRKGGVFFIGGFAGLFILGRKRFLWRCALCFESNRGAPFAKNSSSRKKDTPFTLVDILEECFNPGFSSSSLATHQLCPHIMGGGLRETHTFGEDLCEKTPWMRYPRYKKTPRMRGALSYLWSWYYPPKGYRGLFWTQRD